MLQKSAHKYTRTEKHTLTLRKAHDSHREAQCTRNYSTFNPFHPNISIDILHTVLYTFPKVPLKRICLAIKSLFSW